MSLSDKVHFDGTERTLLEEDVKEAIKELKDDIFYRIFVDTHDKKFCLSIIDEKFGKELCE